MKIDRINLNRVEAQWFSRNVIKTIQSTEELAKQRPELLERSGYRTLIKIADQATSIYDELNRSEDTEAVYSINLTRKQRLIIHEMIHNTSQALEDKIIPEYKRRAEAQPDKFNPYLADTENKLRILKGMARKFK